MDEDELVDVRRRTVAFIFQAFGLVPILTAAENVEVPLRLVHANARERDARVGDAARASSAWATGRSTGRTSCRAASSSGSRSPGRSRTGRELLLADEPTGQLDSETGHVIMLLLRSIVRHEGITAIVATHDPLMLDVADRVFELRDGRFIAPPPGTVR